MEVTHVRVPCEVDEYEETLKWQARALAVREPPPSFCPVVVGSRLRFLMKKRTGLPTEAEETEGQGAREKRGRLGVRGVRRPAQAPRTLVRQVRRDPAHGGGGQAAPGPPPPPS